MKNGMFGDVLFGASAMITMEVEEAGNYGVRVAALANLRMKLADAIVTKKMIEIKNPFYKEYKLELYVFTPEEFDQVINREYIKAKRE